MTERIKRMGDLLDKHGAAIGGRGEALTQAEADELRALLDLPTPAGMPPNVAPPTGAGGGRSAPGTRRAISGPTTRSLGHLKPVRKTTTIGAMPAPAALQALRDIHALATRRAGDYGRILAEIARKCEAAL